MKKKSIENLRNSFDGKVYVRFSSEEVFHRFLEGAESEGYTLGGKRPTEAAVSSDIKAVEYDKTISNCGVASVKNCSQKVSIESPIMIRRPVVQGFL